MAAMSSQFAHTSAPKASAMMHAAGVVGVDVLSALAAIRLRGVVRSPVPVLPFDFTWIPRRGCE